MSDDKKDCGYPHKWEVYRRFDLTDRINGGTIAVVVVRKCSVCHKIERQEVKI